MTFLTFRQVRISERNPHVVGYKTLCRHVVTSAPNPHTLDAHGLNTCGNVRTVTPQTQMVGSFFLFIRLFLHDLELQTEERKDRGINQGCAGLPKWFLQVHSFGSSRFTPSPPSLCDVTQHTSHLSCPVSYTL